MRQFNWLNVGIILMGLSFLIVAAVFFPKEQKESKYERVLELNQQITETLKQQNEYLELRLELLLQINELESKE